MAVPVVTLVSPPEGELSADAVVVVDVTDDSGLFSAIVVLVEFPELSLYEVIHDGQKFGPGYAGVGNGRSTIANGFRYTLARRNGWPRGSRMQLRALAVDAAGGGA